MKMKCKLRVTGAQAINDAENNKVGEKLTFCAVSKSDGYDADGLDENNTFAKFSPSADFTIDVRNPALFDGFKVNEEYYVDFTPVASAPVEAAE